MMELETCSLYPQPGDRVIVEIPTRFREEIGVVTGVRRGGTLLVKLDDLPTYQFAISDWKLPLDNSQNGGGK